ncbi:hypothetical protein [Nocardia vermiculata]|uniref:Uncharacterized protein n=1 Tax=Nocardia vermiculata TaxID=257274 RepID=A0A846XW69_9NOCA|nr:hypothetical protein [Nocardia vermiculata]NKY50222.1 hypothetical protein [Nocardia vermiculata]
MDIVELRTPTAILRHGGGRVQVLRPGTDGERVLDVPVSDLLKVRLNRRADDAVVIEIYLRYPSPVLTGVPADRTPLPVLIAEHDVPPASMIAERINSQILATQRIDMSAPDLTPPNPVWGKAGPTRADVDRAVRRMAPRREVRAAAEALHTIVTPEEFMLETALVTAVPPAGRGRGLLAVTTTRVLLLSIGSTPAYWYEMPVAALIAAEVGKDGDTEPGGDYSIDLTDGNTTLRFVGTDRADTDRIVGAVNFAIQRESADGAVAQPDPGVPQLYSEWELLVERHSLAMVDDAQFQRYGRGILRSLPD